MGRCQKKNKQFIFKNVYRNIYRAYYHIVNTMQQYSSYKTINFSAIVYYITQSIKHLL